MMPTNIDATGRGEKLEGVLEEAMKRLRAIVKQGTVPPEAPPVEEPPDILEITRRMCRG